MTIWTLLNLAPSVACSTLFLPHVPQALVHESYQITA